MAWLSAISAVFLSLLFIRILHGRIQRKELHLRIWAAKRMQVEMMTRCMHDLVVGHVAVRDWVCELVLASVGVFFPTIWVLQLFTWAGMGRVPAAVFHARS